jgi:hypothetical protein
LGEPLVKQLGEEAVETVSTNWEGIIFWQVLMTPQTRAELLTNPTVDFIVSDFEATVPSEEQVKTKRSISRRHRHLGIDKRATTEGDWVTEKLSGVEFADNMLHMGGKGYNRGWYLKSLSQNRGVEMKDLPNEYYYHPSAGEGSTVYVYDTGLKLDNPEIETLEHQPEWILSGMDPNEPSGQQMHSQWGQHTDEASGFGHGTCMLSLAVGKTYGVAKKASSVIVKYPQIKGPKGGNFQRLSNYIMGMAQIADHIAAKGNVKFGSQAAVKAVINQSQGLATKFLTDSDKKDFQNWFIERYKILMDLGAIITTSAGNSRGDDISVTELVPQAWAGEKMPLIVVGNAGPDGKRAAYSQPGEQVTVYASGTDIYCAQGLDDSGTFRHVTGTSEGIESSPRSKYLEISMLIRSFSFRNYCRTFRVFSWPTIRSS